MSQETRTEIAKTAAITSGATATGKTIALDLSANTTGVTLIQKANSSPATNLSTGATIQLAGSGYPANSDVELVWYTVDGRYEIEGGSEFETRPDGLPDDENKTLLGHHDVISRALDERGHFLSRGAREALDALFATMYMGFSMELATYGSERGDDLASPDLYSSVAAKCREAIDALFADLGFKNQ